MTAALFVSRGGAEVQAKTLGGILGEMRAPFNSENIAILRPWHF
jgi:hypothetical protein